MAKAGKEKIDELIKEMSHYDPDNMEMGAKRLTEIILAKEINLEADELIANTVQEAFMKQIESENDTVQSEAIKYLADIVPNLPSTQVQIIFQKILKYISDVNLVERKRERYGACAATVIHQASVEFGNKLSNLFLKSIKKLLEFKDKKTEIEIILINIITQFLKKWPTEAQHLPYDRRNLVIYLLKNVQVKSKLDIIKKSEHCLGKLAVILDREVLEIILIDKDWGLLKLLASNKTKNNIDSLKQQRNALLCLAQIIRTHNVQLRYCIKSTALLLVDIINQFKSSEEIDNIEIVCDILDAALTALSYIFKAFSRQLRQTLQPRNNPFNAFLTQLLNFNVEGMMSYAGQPIDIEDQYQQDQQYYEEAEVDEKCWKVRRSTLFYISFLAKYDRHLLERIGEGQLLQDLGNKLVEEHSLVSEMAFITFNALIDLTSIDRTLNSNEQLLPEDLGLQRVKSSALNVADRLVKQITARIKIVLGNSKFNDQLKIESSKILLRIIQIYNQILTSNQTDTFSLINFISSELKKTNIVENKSTLLLGLKELISQSHPFSKYKDVFQVFLDFVKNNNVKVQNYCLLSIRKTIDLFPSDIQSDPLYPKVLTLLKTKLKQFDSDKLIKYAVTKCVQSLFEFYQLSQEDTVYFLQVLSSKLKIQVEKLYIIEVLNKLTKNTKPSPPKYKVLQLILKQISEHLGSNNYELNTKTIEAIHNILLIIGDQCSQKTIEELLQKSKLLLLQSKIPSFFSLIVQSRPKLLKPYVELIVKSTESAYISKLIQSGVIDVNSCLKILKAIDLNQKHKKISLTLSAIGIKEEQIIPQIDESPWGRILIGTLGYIGTQKTLGLLFNFISTLKAEESRFEVGSAIGNIVSRNQAKLVPELIAQADKSKDVYIFIYIFKEMLNYNVKPFAYVTQLIEWLLTNSENKFEAESNYYITSECVGKLAFVSQEATQKVIASAQADNENRRLIVANSLRYGLQNHSNLSSPSLPSYIDTIVHLLNDDKVRVREGAIKSLVNVGQLFVKGLQKHIHNYNFWKVLISNCTINNTLILVIDYGICKQIRDEGKNLRLESLNLLQILVKKVQIEPQLVEELMAVVLNRLNQQSSNDILLKRLNILKSLCQLDYAHFIRLQQDFIRKIGFKEGIFKKYQSKPVEDERAEIYIKGVLKEIQHINQLAKQENIDTIATFLAELRANPTIGPLLTALEKTDK